MSGEKKDADKTEEDDSLGQILRYNILTIDFRNGLVLTPKKEPKGGICSSTRFNGKVKERMVVMPIISGGLEIGEIREIKCACGKIIGYWEEYELCRDWFREIFPSHCVSYWKIVEKS